MARIFRNWIPCGLHFGCFLVISLNLLTRPYIGVFGLPSDGRPNLQSRIDAQSAHDEVGPNATEDADQVLSSKIDQVANSLQKCVQYPGMSLAVVKLSGPTNIDSEPMILTRHYGVMDIESKRPVDEDTRFCIGSVTKAFTAALLLQLLKENGSYTLDTPVRSILGLDFRLITNELTEKTTIRDILAHRVGIAKHFGAFLMGYNFTRPEIVRRVRHLPVLKEFRSSQVYNNFLYVIAGQLIEKLNGSWWETQTVSNIFKPLKMAKTTFADKVADWNANFALPHALENGKLRTIRAKVTGNILRPMGPAGSICSSAGDMAEYLLMHLQKGIGRNGQTVFNSSVFDDIFGIQNPFPKSLGLEKSHFDVEALAMGYGLGWVVGNYRDTRRIFHSGFANYYYTMVSILPEKDIAIYSSMNGPHLIKCDNGMKALHFYIMDLLLGEKPWLNASNICGYPRQWLRKTTGDFQDKLNRVKTPVASISTTLEDQESSSWITTLPSVDETITPRYDTTVPNSPLDFPTSPHDTSVSLSSSAVDETQTISTYEDPGIVTDSFSPDKFYRRTVKLKKRLRKTTPFSVTASTLGCRDLRDCETSSPQHIFSSSSGGTAFPSLNNMDRITTFNLLPSTEPSLVSESTEPSPTSDSTDFSSPDTSTTYGIRLRPGKRPLRRRRPRLQRSVELFSHFKRYEGTYSNSFFGDVVISINRTVPALQLNYGYYGKALLEPLSRSDVFRMHFFNSIWYQSESDDMKLFAKLGMFDVQFGNSNKDAFLDKLVVFQFDTEKPPVFMRHRQKQNAVK